VQKDLLQGQNNPTCQLQTILVKQSIILRLQSHICQRVSCISVVTRTDNQQIRLKVRCSSLFFQTAAGTQHRAQRQGQIQHIVVGPARCFPCARIARELMRTISNLGMILDDRCAIAVMHIPVQDGNAINSRLFVVGSDRSIGKNKKPHSAIPKGVVSRGRASTKAGLPVAST